MSKGTIVENSLKDKGVLKRLQIKKSWKAGAWTLHDVLVTENQIPDLAKSLDEGPWYIHVWRDGSDEVKVIFKERIFTIKHSDRATWHDAVSYGKSIHIPEEQLDFPIQ